MKKTQFELRGPLCHEQFVCAVVHMMATRYPDNPDVGIKCECGLKVNATDLAKQPDEEILKCSRCGADRNGASFYGIRLKEKP